MGFKRGQVGACLVTATDLALTFFTHWLELSGLNNCTRSRSSSDQKWFLARERVELLFSYELIGYPNWSWQVEKWYSSMHQQLPGWQARTDQAELIDSLSWFWHFLLRLVAVVGLTWQEGKCQSRRISKLASEWVSQCSASNIPRLRTHYFLPRILLIIGFNNPHA